MVPRILVVGISKKLELCLNYIEHRNISCKLHFIHVRDMCTRSFRLKILESIKLQMLRSYNPKKHHFLTTFSSKKITEIKKQKTVYSAGPNMILTILGSMGCGLLIRC